MNTQSETPRACRDAEIPSTLVESVLRVLFFPDLAQRYTLP